VCDSFCLLFPQIHKKQWEFKKISKAGFATCVGAINGVLIWTERPREEDCKIAKCGPKKLFWGRKKKFGLLILIDRIGFGTSRLRPLWWSLS
jgi:hypothetical protein